MSLAPGTRGSRRRRWPPTGRGGGSRGRRCPARLFRPATSLDGRRTCGGRYGRRRRDPGRPLFRAGRKIDGVSLAALLTVIGYSVNDSGLIFGRTRERTEADLDRPLVRIADHAALKTVSHTISTGLSASLVFVVVWALRGEALVAFGLIIDIVVGVYSSVAAAMPLAMVLEGGRSEGAAATAAVRMGGGSGAVRAAGSST